MRPKEEIRQQVAAKVATFAVGDKITFIKPDDAGCTEDAGDPVEVELEGVILSINGQQAQVEHQYGVCQVWLAIASKCVEGTNNP